MALTEDNSAGTGKPRGYHIGPISIDKTKHPTSSNQLCEKDRRFESISRLTQKLTATTSKDNRAISSILDKTIARQDE